MKALRITRSTVSERTTRPADPDRTWDALRAAFLQVPMSFNKGHVEKLVNLKISAREAEDPDTCKFIDDLLDDIHVYNTVIVSMQL